MNLELLLGRFYRVRREVADARSAGINREPALGRAAAGIRVVKATKVTTLQLDSTEDTAPAALYRDGPPSPIESEEQRTRISRRERQHETDVVRELDRSA